MNLEFEDDGFRKWLIEEHPEYKTLCKKVNKNILKALVRRRNELLAAETFQKYLSYGLGRPHPLVGDLKGDYGVSLTGNYRLIFKPVSSDLSPESLKKCDTVILKGVDDYHGEKSNWILP